MVVMMMMMTLGTNNSAASYGLRASGESRQSAYSRSSVNVFLICPLDQPLRYIVARRRLTETTFHNLAILALLVQF